MKQKIKAITLQIKACIDCPYCILQPRLPGHTCKKTLEIIDDSDICYIQDWCPLDDYKED